MNAICRLFSQENPWAENDSERKRGRMLPRQSTPRHILLRKRISARQECACSAVSNPEKGGGTVGRYKTERAIVDVSPVPFIPMFAKKTVIIDMKTSAKAEGYDWLSFRESDRKALEKLRRLQ